MGMTPDRFYEAFVLGNYDDYNSNPECVRRAFNAAVATNHLADHYLEYYKRNDPSKVIGFDTIGDYVEHISKNTMGAFKDLRSMANAYKHLYTGTKPKHEKHSSINSAGAIEFVQFENEDIREVSENWSPRGVYYTTKTGNQKSFSSTLETVINYWRGIFD